MNGILLVIKPPGMTSFDVVAWLRGLVGVKKIGHAGTLDPAACGLLPVCIGKATKAIDYFQEFDKAYRAEMVLGVVTDTQDGEGDILEEHPVRLDIKAIHSAMETFVGAYDQVPPMYSAVKVNGKRLYDLARKGIVLERGSRRVTIASLELLQAELEDKPARVRFDVTCSKGTYIRTLCADIGQKLGCGAYMSFLIRTRVGPFSLNHALTLEEIKKRRDEKTLIPQPIDILFQKYPSVFPGENNLKRFLNGALTKSDMDAGKTVRVYSETGLFIGLGTILSENGESLLKPEKLFASP